MPYLNMIPSSILYTTSFGKGYKDTSKDTQLEPHNQTQHIMKPNFDHENECSDINVKLIN